MDQVPAPVKKSPFLSRTLWTNFIVALVAFFPVANEWIAGNPLFFTIAFSVVNMFLRFITKDPLKVIE